MTCDEKSHKWNKFEGEPIPAPDACILLKASNGHRQITYTGWDGYFGGPENDFDWVEWMICP